jgi:predicted MFS family arabinose efflux permease
MSILAAARISHAQIVALSAIGVCWGSFAAIVPAIKARIGAADGPMGLALMMSAVGGILAMYLAPHLVPVLRRWLLPVAGLLLAAVSALPLLSWSVASFGAAMFCLGLAMSSYDMSTNMRIALLETRHGRHLQNLNHAMFSFSFAGSAFVTTLARKAGATPLDVVPWLMAVLALMAVFSDEGRGWTPGLTHRDEPHSRLPWNVVLVVAAILFAAFLSENANEAWSALHIERTLGAAVGEGGFGPTMLGLTMGIGRMSGQVLTARMGEVRLIFLGALMGVAGLTCLALAPAVWVAVTGIGIFGLGIAVMVPTANALLSRIVPPALQGLAIARAWMIGFTGFFVGPSAIGMIAEATNLRVAFLCVAGLVATIPPLVLALRRHGA